ncbi:MAG: cytochrome b [Oleiphilus sp.]|nr:MAG: cytochrome b [Oleiphilus sp.]
MPNFWKNQAHQWSITSISLHWLSALLVFTLYPLGWYMVELDYYDAWYRTAPYWHKGLGLLLFALILLRLTSRMSAGKVAGLPSHQAWEIRVASLVHFLLYVLLLISCVSGYMISTADGRGISFFDLFEVPAWTIGLDQQEELAGTVHEWVTNMLIGLAGVHALAALKHHFYDRDATILRMLGRNRG